jgi:hypothetical protein
MILFYKFWLGRQDSNLGMAESKSLEKLTKLGAGCKAEGSRAVSQRIESQGIPESGLFMIHVFRRFKEAADDGAFR